MLYVVICIALAMASVAGLQFFYLAYTEKVIRQQKRKLVELERQRAALDYRLQDLERVLAHYQTLQAEELIEEEEVWSEIIED